MSQNLTGTALVAYLRDNPTSDAMRAAADEIERLQQSLRDLMRGYIYTLEGGRDRIVSLGGQCDPVDVMEAADPYLRSARAALAQEQGASDA